MTPTEKLKQLGLELPPAPSALGIYKPAMTIGDLCYTSGHLPVQLDGSLMTGCVGTDVDQEFGYNAARQAGLDDFINADGILGVNRSSGPSRQAVWDGLL